MAAAHTCERCLSHSSVVLQSCAPVGVNLCRALTLLGQAATGALIDYSVSAAERFRTRPDTDGEGDAQVSETSIPKDGQTHTCFSICGRLLTAFRIKLPRTAVCPRRAPLRPARRAQGTARSPRPLRQHFSDVSLPQSFPLQMMISARLSPTAVHVVSGCWRKI